MFGQLILFSFRVQESRVFTAQSELSSKLGGAGDEERDVSVNQQKPVVGLTWQKKEESTPTKVR